MENASKALLIAGGVLISLIIIGMAVYVFSSAKNVQEDIAADSKAEQIKQYNKQYEAYNKKVMRGIDIITVTNKVIDNNKNHPEYPIEIVVKINYDSTTTTAVLDGLTKKSYYFAGSDRLKYTNLLNNVSNVNIFKQERFFECTTNMGYKNVDGRVSKMEFNEITETVLRDKINYQ